MKRKFLSDLVFIQMLNLLVKGVWVLLIDLAVQNFLPVQDYVDYSVALNYSIFFIILLDFGMNSFNNREVAADRSFLNEHFFSILLLKFLFSIFTMALALALAAAIGFSQRELLLVTAMLSFQVMASYNQYLRSNISALQKFKLDGVISVLDRFLVVAVLAIPFYVVPDLLSHVTLTTFVGAQIGAVFITLLINLAINFTFLQKPQYKIHLAPLLHLIKSALPFALLAALMSIYTRIDVVMLRQMSVLAEVDHYIMSYRLLDAGNMFTILLAAMLLPMFARLMKNREPVNWLTAAASRLILLPGIVAVALLMAWSTDFMQLLYPLKATAGTGAVFFYLIPSFLGSGLIYIYGTMLTAARDLRFLNYLAAVCTIFNVAGNYFVIPHYGASGAAVVTVATQMAFGLGCFARSKTRFHLVFGKSELFKTLGYIFLMILIVFGLKQYFQNEVVHSLITMITAFIILLATGLIKRREVLRIFKKRTTQTI